jgi:hypothetical protein
MRSIVVVDGTKIAIKRSESTAAERYILAVGEETVVLSPSDVIALVADLNRELGVA